MRSSALILSLALASTAFSKPIAYTDEANPTSQSFTTDSGFTHRPDHSSNNDVLPRFRTRTRTSPHNDINEASHLSSKEQVDSNTITDLRYEKPLLSQRLNNNKRSLAKRGIELDVDDPPSYHDPNDSDDSPGNEPDKFHVHPFGTPHSSNEPSSPNLDEDSLTSPPPPTPYAGPYPNDLSPLTLRILSSRLSHSRIWGSDPESNLNNLLPIPKKGRWGYELEFDGYGLMVAFQRWVGYDEWRVCGWRRECMDVEMEGQGG